MTIDHLLYDLTIEREGKQFALRGRVAQRSLRATFGADAGVQINDVVIDGSQRFVVAEISEARDGAGAVHHIEAKLRR